MKNRLSSTLAIYIVLSVFAVIFVYPFIWMVINSLRTNHGLYLDPWGISDFWHWENYVKVWTRTMPTSIANDFMNSLIVVSCSVILLLVITSTAAFAFTRIRFKGTVLYYPMLATLALPIEVLVLPLFLIISAFHLQGSYLGLIVPYTVSGIPLGTFILAEFFKEIPTSLEEAAVLDGCSNFRVFREVIIPISKPALLAVVTLQFLLLWNEFLLALVVNGSFPALHTVPVGINMFASSYLTDYISVFTVLSITSLPVLVLFALLQKQFIQGITVGATKL